jgi:hypothetical protein
MFLGRKLPVRLSVYTWEDNIKTGIKKTTFIWLGTYFFCADDLQVHRFMMPQRY